MPAPPQEVAAPAVEPRKNRKLPRAPEDLPEIVVTSNDVIQGKPHPDCFLKALERPDVSACDAIAFEDAAAGLAAGRAAGCRIVALATTSEAERLEPEDWVYDFERIELLEVQSDGKLLLRFN